MAAAFSLEAKRAPCHHSRSLPLAPRTLALRAVAEPTQDREGQEVLRTVGRFLHRNQVVEGGDEDGDTLFHRHLLGARDEVLVGGDPGGREEDVEVAEVGFEVPRVSRA